MAEEIVQEVEKRGPGRPKGTGVKRGPGRPKGGGKRGPGRPKGPKRGPGRAKRGPKPRPRSGGFIAQAVAKQVKLALKAERAKSKALVRSLVVKELKASLRSLLR